MSRYSVNCPPNRKPINGSGYCETKLENDVVDRFPTIAGIAKNSSNILEGAGPS
jgi:hypothetical protein